MTGLKKSFKSTVVGKYVWVLSDCMPFYRNNLSYPGQKETKTKHFVPYHKTTSAKSQKIAQDITQNRLKILQ